MNKKNGMLVALFVFCFVLFFVSLLFYINLRIGKTIEVEAIVKMLGDDYIVVKDDNNREYYLEIEEEYNVGDRVDFLLKNVKDGVDYIKGDLVKIEIVSQKVNFEIMDDQNNNVVSNAADLTGGEATFTDSDVIGVFTTLNNDLSNYNQNDNMSDKLKSSFVLVIDFLFYDGQIKGKTFDGLGNDAKIKVLQLALSIDKKIDKYFPGYKDAISINGKKVYTNVKAKVLELYLDITSSVCENNADVCETAKQGLRDMKDSFSITWDFIKEIGISSVGKLDKWYRVWKET